MTRPSLAGIEKRTAAATAETFEVTYGTRERARVWIEDDTTPFAEFIVGEAADAQLFAHARTDLDALTAAVRDVLALHRAVEVEPSDTICAGCSTLRGAGESLRYFPVTEHPCPTVRALATHLDLTDPEGDPT